MNPKSHWSNIYKTKVPTDVSWYQERPSSSLEFIQNTGVGLDAHIIDVGAGSSTLVDHLLRAGYHNITLLDISEEALQLTRNRIDESHLDKVEWLVGDITNIPLTEYHYDIWHDRAFFHFLTDSHLRRRYIEQVKRAVKPNGDVIMATFATDGPNQCSGLDVVQYDSSSLQSVFGEDFQLISSNNESHQTPWGAEQKFVYCHCRKQEK